jgi:hypothetical protein
MPRPKGSKNLWKPDILVKNKERLQKKAVALALNGNETCMRICMDRLYPRLRNIAPPVKVGSTDSSDLASQGAAIVAAALNGQLTPDVAHDLLSSLGDLARLKEFTEVEQRLAALETRADAPPWAKQSGPEMLPIRGRKRRRNERPT